MTTIAYEINFDGLVGITHNYAGLALGNIPSMENAGEISYPKKAALQGLRKMRLLASLGIKQAVLPPQERPHIPTLKNLGFSGTKPHILNETHRTMPWFLPLISSSASMWTANAATVSPSIDCSDSKVHFTPANLATYFHRAIETETTARLLKAIFKNSVFFYHHDPLFDGGCLHDEGSANHIRFCNGYHLPGVHLFVFGKAMAPSDSIEVGPTKFPARQMKEAQEAICRLHQHFPKNSLFAQQHPEAIDAGVFHNDLISLGNQNVFVVHEKAFWQQESLLYQLQQTVSETCDTRLITIQIADQDLPLQEAVHTYFFNSQLVTLADHSMAWIAPIQCQTSESVQKVLKSITEDKNNPISSIHYVDLTESMQNGGGPACLRLKVVLTEKELAEINPGVLFTERLHQRLTEYVTKHYPETLTIQDLASPKLYEKNCAALHELTQILELGKIYSFQL